MMKNRVELVELKASIADLLDTVVHRIDELQPVAPEQKRACALVRTKVEEASLWLSTYKLGG